jgi:hypothetical protein
MWPPSYQEKYLRKVLGVYRETPGRWKGRVRDTNGLLKRKEKKHGEEGEREILSEKRVC